MIENDRLVRKTRAYSAEYNAPVYKTEVVITKEEFLECYNAWIKGIEDEGGMRSEID